MDESVVDLEYLIPSYPIEEKPSEKESNKTKEEKDKATASPSPQTPSGSNKSAHKPVATPEKFQKHMSDRIHALVINPECERPPPSPKKH